LKYCCRLERKRICYFLMMRERSCFFKSDGQKILKSNYANFEKDKINSHREIPKVESCPRVQRVANFNRDWKDRHLFQKRMWSQVLYIFCSVLRFLSGIFFFLFPTYFSYSISIIFIVAVLVLAEKKNKEKKFVNFTCMSIQKKSFKIENFTAQQ
jgi:hypothetical protein